MTGGCVVVLGPTGRNFAAGMSGGTAYVLDEDGGFAGRCNLQLVGLEEPSDDDREALRALIGEHAERTGSTVAARVLALGDDAPFVKVMPHDFKRVLEQPLSVGGAGFVTRETEAAA
jgi:glutamate synthase domain-containing protein 3